MPLPLSGFKVLDFTHVISGPVCTRNLALLGADVIKIEATTASDAMRLVAPREDCAGQTPHFIAVNCGKRSLLVNLKSPSGTELIRRLAATADVLVENFRPGVMDRLGIGYDAIRSVAPQIIYCSISGYGQSGPWREYPAYDNVIQAVSGMINTSGNEDDAPMQVGFVPADSFAGQLATQAILAAALKRERFGEGDLIDVSLLDASLVLMLPMAGASLVSSEPIPRRGNSGFAGTPMPGVDLFPAREGYLMMSASTNAHFTNLSALFEREDLTKDPRFASVASRGAHKDELAAILREAMAGRTALDWEVSLNRLGIPAAAMRDVATVVSEPHMKSRQLLQPLHIPGASRQNIEVLGLGYEMSGVPPRPPAPPPQRGEHTDVLLEEAGYTAAEIEKLRSDSVIA